MIDYYKIVDLTKDKKSIRTLFHGVNGSRIIPFDTWVQAERKWGGEGGRKYWTGFHIFKKLEIAEKYFKRFTDKSKSRIIVKCLANGLRPKESSRGNVFLADEIKIPHQNIP